AKLYRTVYPDEQILVIMAREKAMLIKKETDEIDAAQKLVDTAQAAYEQAQRTGRSRFRAQADLSSAQRNLQRITADVNRRANLRYQKFRATEENNFFANGVRLYKEPKPGTFDKEELDGEKLVKFLSALTIDSLHVFGHTGARSGLALHGDRF